MKINNNNGSVLVATLLILSIVVSTGYYMADQVLQNRNSTLGTYQKAKSNIETENLVKIASQLAQTKIQEVPAITEAEMQIYLSTELPKYITPPLEIKNFAVKFSGTSYYAPLGNGPFKGMDAENQKLQLDLTVGPISNSTVNYKSSTVKVETTSSVVPITQFTFFSTSNLFQAIGYQSVEMSGRIHSNGLLALAGTNQQTKIRGSLTSARQILSPQTIWGSTYPWQTHIALAPTYTDATLTRLKETASSGCISCDGTASPWSIYALERWQGQVQDRYHGVPELLIKTLELPRAQYENTRFPIEPVRAGENLARKQKFAYKADVRIINGVWYLKNPANEEEWPGVPIWSDHPGSFTTWNDDNIEGSAKAVGQEDIRTWLDTSGPSVNRWPTNTVPQKFSFYTYDTSNQQLTNNSSGTVSYGNLFRQAGTPVNWIPGHYPSSSLCLAGETCVSGCGNTVESINAPITCQDAGGVQVVRSNPTANLLNATRGGFRYGVIQQTARGFAAKSKMWPMNFDLKAFQNALSCRDGVDHPGELGCYFGERKFINRPFNGVVYIANTWDGQNRLTGFNGYPQRAPYMQNDPEVIASTLEGGGTGAYPGTTIDPNQPAPHAATQSQLPMQLCSTSLAGQKFTATHFVIPNCSSYKNHTVLKSRINSLRIINAAELSATALPKGISIVTNLPLFSTGDVNSSSNVTSPTSTPWLPVFIGGDDYVPLSNAWNDSYARWDISTGDPSIASLRRAANTVINAANSPKVFLYAENWAGRSLRKTGPHINFASSPFSYMFAAATIGYGSATYNNPATIYYLEDPHFRSIFNQPPGVPYVSIFTVNAWVTKDSSNEK